MAATMGNVNVTSVCTEGDLRRLANEKSLIVHDEYDFWLLDRLGPVLIDVAYTVGFTATDYSSKKGNEYAYLSGLGVSHFDSKIPKLIDPDQVHKPESLDEWLQDSVVNFESSLIIYTEGMPEVVDELIAFVNNRGWDEWIVNCQQEHIISDIGKRVLIVKPDQYELLRGLDYQSKLPIHLLIMHPLPNQRAYL